MRKVIDGLVELCKEQPFDTERIANFIKSNDMSSEEVTRAAIGVAEYGAFSYSDYLHVYEKRTAAKRASHLRMGSIVQDLDR